MGRNKVPVARIVGVFILLYLSAIYIAPEARAQSPYVGIGYGRANSEDIDTDNLVFVVGQSYDSGLGFELFYAPTIDEDEISSGMLSADITLDTYGLMVFYKSDDDVFGSYLKIGGGIAVVDLEFDFGSLGSLDDDTSGLTYGLTIGTRVGNGAIEFSYYVLPEFDDFEGIDVDAEVDLFTFSYLWQF